MSVRQHIDRGMKGQNKYEKYDSMKGMVLQSLETQIGENVPGRLADVPDLLHRLHVLENVIVRLPKTIGNKGSVPFTTHVPDVVHQVGIDLLKLLHGEATR